MSRHSPWLIAVKKFLSTPASSPCPILCSLQFHLLAIFVLARTFTEQIYFIRIKWWILLCKKSRHGLQYVQSHIRPFALLCCCPVNRAQAVQDKLGFSCWGRKRGHKQQINKASASPYWRLHWKMASVLVKAMFLWFNGDNQFFPEAKISKWPHLMLCPVVKFIKMSWICLSPLCSISYQATNVFTL